MAQTKVTKPGIADDAVETTTIKNLNVTNAKIAAGTIDVTAKITGIVPAANLGTGTASATTYLAGDGSYKTISEYDDNQVQSNIAMLGFKVATNGSLVKYNLVDQTIDEFNDTSGVDASASTNESRSGAAPYYYFGGTSPTVTEDADSTGTSGSYTWYAWTDISGTGSYQSDIAQNSDILVIAGGGGGGGGFGGAGGGAGGFKYYSQYASVGTSAHTITIGDGGTLGASGNPAGGQGGNGNDSSFGSLTATAGGGGGGGGTTSGVGSTGGSGGGGGQFNSIAGGSGTANQGNNGGAANAGTTGSSEAGGGGGGAGAVGQTASAAGGNGGAGYTEGSSTVYDWTLADGTTATFNINGTGTGYGGGGGGGTRSGTGGTGTDGGGNAKIEGTGGDGTDGTGGGGGGNNGGVGYGSGAGAYGGSGVVILRRLTIPTILNMTLQSTDSTAGSAPTYGEFVTLIENAYGTATLNTDIKGYISRDSGTTFTQGTLVDEGTWGTNKKILGFHDLDISAQPSGTSMCYKITTHNQVASSKETRVYASSIGWR